MEGERIVRVIQTSIYRVCEAEKIVPATFTAWIKQGFPCFFHFRNRLNSSLMRVLICAWLRLHTSRSRKYLAP
ncbi:TPA: hypothetical protein MJB68_24490 [Klebsiella pneumoniae]|nr:hypothetical protein [Klebsiella pneumoniae]MBM5557703.1 hypothetical protein [Klebsiella quasipneumoniae]MBZ6759341.1 hypothetical protein [Klebsiella grimontii]MBZ7321646.1 hypothetical protein [Klebsiella oxytoca]MBZ7756308.1 hypothetical protein [Raoultella ornithinolytica]QEE13481.1 hypothetical protein CAY66_31620 [Klebsiella variicola]